MRRLEVLLVVFIAAVAVAVRAPPAFDYALWQDEVFSLRAVDESSPVGMLRHVVRAESTPPLWYALAWLWRQLGAGAETLRLISVACGALLSVGTVLAGRRFLTLWGAGLAGLLIALGWQPLMHGWEIRSYELFALLCLVFVVALEWTAGAPSRARLVALAGIEAAGTLTHYFFLFTVLAGVIWICLGALPRATVRRLLVWLGVGMIPLAVWSPAAWHQYRAGRFSFIGPFDGREVVFAYAHEFVRGLPHGTMGWLVAVLVSAAVFGGCWRLGGISNNGRLYALAAVVPVGAAALLWLAGAHIFLARNLIGAAPFAALALGALVDAFPRRMVIPVTAAASALVLASYTQAREPAPPAYDAVAKTLVAQGWTKGTPIVLFGSLYDYLHPLGWYLPDGDSLAKGRFLASPCETVFIVSAGGRAHALVRRAQVSTRVGRIEVGRLAWRDDLPTQTRRRGGFVLVSGSQAPCARPASAD
jgi:hypothetical protein